MQRLHPWGAALAAMVIVASLVPSVAAQEGGKLKVTVNYNGPGTVDASHELHVWVFDTPNITADSVPLAAETLTANGGSLNFSGLPKEVYIAAAFDEKGDYDGSAAPPAGTPIVIYGDAGVAKAIATGSEAVVNVVFDDSQRMQ